MKKFFTFCLITLLLITCFGCSNNTANEKIDNAIDDYIAKKIEKEDLETNNEKVDFTTAVHETLKIKEKDDKITYYISYYYGGYEFENEYLVFRNGESGIATISLKKVSNASDDYKITKFDEGIDKKMATSLKIVPTTKEEAREKEKEMEENQKKMQKLTDEKAREYLKEIGSDAKLKVEEDD